MSAKLSRKRESTAGFTLIEVLVTMGVLILVVVTLLQLFIHCQSLAEIAKLTTFAVAETQGKLAEIRHHNFDTLVTDYGSGGTPGNIFNLTQLNGVGRIYIDNTNPQLKRIEIVLSWRTKNNRIIGEDTNLNGALDSGEDTNSNNRLDSPTTLVTLIAER